MLVTLNILAIVDFLLLAILFVYRKSATRNNLFLAFLMITPIFAHFFNTLIYLDLILNFPFALALSFLFNLLWGPCFYFYVMFSIGKRQSFKLLDLLHTIPSVFSVVYSLIIAFSPVDVQATIFSSIKTHPPFMLNLLNQIMMLQTFTYMFLSWVMLKRYNRSLKHLFSDIHQLSAIWLQEFIIVMVFIGMLAFIPIMLFPQIETFMIFLPIGSTLCYFFLVYKNISTPIVFSKQVQELLLLAPETEVEQTPETAKGQSHEMIKQYAEKLNAYLLAEKSYQNSGINIKTLSVETGIGVHHISETINKEFNRNFFDYINSFRVEKAKQLLLSPEKDCYTIESIAQEVGFNSRSTFYTAFKKESGITPTEYKNKCRT